MAEIFGLVFALVVVAGSLTFYVDSRNPSSLSSKIINALHATPRPAPLYKLSFSASPSAKIQTPAKSAAQSQPVGLGYTIDDVNNLVRDLNQADQDFKTIQNYKGNSSYNQATVDKIIELIPQRKALAQKLLDKMGKNEPLTQADFSIWDQYTSLTNQQYSLVGSLYKNGGF